MHPTVPSLFAAAASLWLAGCMAANSGPGTGPGARTGTAVGAAPAGSPAPAPVPVPSPAPTPTGATAPRTPASAAPAPAPAVSPGGIAAVVQLAPTQGNSTSGTVRFAQSSGRVTLSGEVRGLQPNAEHGFHVHEKGECGPDGEAAGDHFNPVGTGHGQPGGDSHHAGDLPSLKADAQGVAKFSVEAPLLTIGSGASDIVGKTLVVHKDPDDYKTQPSGNTGARVACGVIRRG